VLTVLASYRYLPCMGTALLFSRAVLVGKPESGPLARAGRWLSMGAQSAMGTLAKNPFSETTREASPGDIVFAFVATVIAAVGFAQVVLPEGFDSWLNCAVLGSKLQRLTLRCCAKLLTSNSIGDTECAPGQLVRRSLSQRPYRVTFARRSSPLFGFAPSDHVSEKGEIIVSVLLED